jgi:two-component system OmpR family response regulator
MRILIVEDDQDTAETLRKGLTESGHQVQLAADGHAGLRASFAGNYDALIVDRMLPGMEGLDLIASLRSAGSSVPILVLSALGEVEHRVEGLQGGADDYLPKPFAFSELLARLEALERRAAPTAREIDSPPRVLKVGDLCLDLEKHTANRAGKTIPLQPREYRLLEFLMRHPGRILTRGMLLERVWSYHFDPGTNVIDVHISRLRAKIDKGFDRPLLHTVRGAGYRLEDRPPYNGG